MRFIRRRESAASSEPSARAAGAAGVTLVRVRFRVRVRVRVRVRARVRARVRVRVRVRPNPNPAPDRGHDGAAALEALEPALAARVMRPAERGAGRLGEGQGSGWG